MIKTLKDLFFYIGEDRKRNDVKSGYGAYLKGLIYCDERVRAFRYLKCLRICEYLKNNRNWYNRCLFQYYWLKYNRLGSKYHLKVQLNTAGYGLRLLHISGGGGILLNANKIGNYCGFNAGVLLGNKDSQDNRVTVGDYVAFGPGSKAIGKLVIGDNVFIAPNSVVTKDLPSNCIAGGIPAKVIKEYLPKENAVYQKCHK